MFNLIKQTLIYFKIYYLYLWIDNFHGDWGLGIGDWGLGGGGNAE